MFLYNRSSILDKYVARTWFTAFIMCTAILTLIYIIGDFADNVGDLMNLDAPLMGTFRFYLSQLPMILNLILPYTLILRNHRHAAVRTVPAPNQHPHHHRRRLCLHLLRHLRVPLGAQLRPVQETDVLLPEPEQK